jgi:GGDEF domain-containing protein
MAGFHLRDIEFQSDGVSDSLTETMSPGLFHENLQREIAAAKRDGRELAVLALALKPDNFNSAAAFQEALIEIAFALRTGLRGGDFFARIADRGFWVLLRTSETHGQTVVNRLDLPRQDDLDIYIVARKYDEHSEWIERIDSIYFK